MGSGYQVNSSEHHVKNLEELGGDPTQVPILRPHHLIPPLWVEREAAAVWEDALVKRPARSKRMAAANRNCSGPQGAGVGLYSAAGRQNGFSSRTVFVWEGEVKFKVRSE